MTALPVCVLGRKWRVRGSHPAVRAYEAPMSTDPRVMFRVADSGTEPDDRPYESPLGTCRICIVFCQ